MVMMRLISWSCIMMKLTNKKPEGKEKNRYSEEEVDWYTICKICLIRKSVHSDITLSMIKYHQPLLKIKIFSKKDSRKNKMDLIWYCLLYLLSHQLMCRVIHWSIHQIHKNFFHLSQNILSCIEVKILELKRD